MNSYLSPKDWSQILCSSAACVLLLSHALVLADTTSDDASRTLIRSDSAKTAAPLSSPDKEQVFLPESAFVHVDPDAPAPKLLAPLRPTARSVEPDVSIAPQTKSRARSASETAGQSIVTQTGTATQAGEITRVELRRVVKPLADPERVAIEKALIDKAVTVSALPEQKLPPKPPPSLPTRVSEPAPIKLNPGPISQSVATQSNATAPLIKNKVPSRLPALERDDRLHHSVTTPTATAPDSASSTQSDDDFLAAKNTLAESTAKLRVIEKTIQDMQQLLPSPSPATVPSNPLLLAALPYASVTAPDSAETAPPHGLTNGATNKASSASENTEHAINNQTPLGQWGLLQLILCSLVAGIAGYVVLHRSSTSR